MTKQKNGKITKNIKKINIQKDSVKKRKTNFLIDLKNAKKSMINDLSDCDFYDKDKLNPELLNRTPIKKQKKISVNKITQQDNTIKTIKATKSMAKIQIPNLEKPIIMRRRRNSRILNSTSKNKLEIIDCDSDDGGFITFEDWSKNIVAFSTPLKEETNGRVLIQSQQKHLTFDNCKTPLPQTKTKEIVIN